MLTLSSQCKDARDGRSSALLALGYLANKSGSKEAPQVVEGDGKDAAPSED